MIKYSYRIIVFTSIFSFLWLISAAQNRIFHTYNDLALGGAPVPVSIAGPLIVERSVLGPELASIPGAVYFNINESNIRSIVSEKPTLISFDLPVTSTGNVVRVKLFNKKPYTSAAIVKTDKGERFPMTEAAYYRGYIDGDPNSLVALSFYDGQMAGTISSDDLGNLDIGQTKNARIHTIYKPNELPYQPKMSCGTIDEAFSDEIDDVQHDVTRDAGDCVQVYMEADFHLFQNKGSVQNTENYINNFFNVVSSIYYNENIEIAISEIFVWTSDDPYPENNSSSALNYFTDFRDDFNGDLAHLVTLDPGGLGGIAWLNVLCDNDTRHAYSDIFATYSELPAYSWTIMVVTHELGHNIGSQHTHWCGWTGGAIDNCEETEGSCSPGPPPINGGTVMSYCHLTSHGINLNHGFGMQPGNRIRTRVNNANCLIPDCGNNCPTFIINGDVQHVQCNGETSGSITVTQPAQGVPPFTYNWNNGGTGQTISNLDNGSYTVTIADANNCIGNQTFVVNEPSVININEVITNLSCFGSNNGSIVIGVTGGTPGYTYLWSNGAVTQSIFQIGPGQYTLTVTDDNGCEQTETYTVFQPAELNIDSYIEQITCYDNNDGSITVYPSGGTQPLSYTWSTGSHNATIFNLGQGTYTVTITDANDCETSAQYSLFDPPLLTVDMSGTDITFEGANDGTVTAEPVGGTPNYSYLWSTGATTSTITNLGPGTYFVTIQDENGCDATGSFTVNEPDCALSLSIDSDNISCHGMADGYAEANPLGQSGTTSFQWSNGATTQTISGLNSGTYTVTVTDQNCSQTASVVISSPAQLNSSVQSQPSACNQQNGSATVTTNGGTFPYEYAWSNGGTGNIQTGLAAGNYTVTITDANDCAMILSVTVNSIDSEAPVQIVNNLVIYLDFEGQYTFNGSQGLQYFADNCNLNTVVLNPNTLDCSDIGSTTIQAIANDFAGNTSTGNIQVSVLDTVSPSIICPNDIEQGLCQGEVFWEAPVVSDNCTITSVILTEGLHPGTLFPVGSTIQTYIVTDQSGNQSQCSFNVTVTEGLVLTLKSKNMSCHDVPDGNASVDTTGLVHPLTISWSTGEKTPQINNLAAGTYSVTVIDGNGCEFERSVEVVNPPLLEMEIVNIIHASGAGNADGAVEISVTGGTPNYTFEWYKDGILISSDQNLVNVTAGTYRLILKDQNACTIVSSEIIVNTVLSTSSFEETAFAVYPNPANELLIVNQLTGMDQSLQFDLVDALGRTYRLNSSNQLNKYELSVNEFALGNYVLRIVGHSKFAVFKIVISR